jgi:transglutaminase-like putative cysteine protease
MSSRFVSRLGVAALAATMAWTALWSWGGLVESPGRFIDPAVVGALLIVTVGAAGRTLRWPWYAVLPAQLVVVLLWLDHRYASAEAQAGWIPTTSSIKALADRIHDGAVAVNTFASPVSSEHPETYAYLLSTAMLVLLSTDLFACGLRRVPWAGLPVIVTLTVPISVLETGLSWITFTITAMLFMMLLATEETARVLGWGRSVAGRGERIDSLDQVVNGATVRGAAFRIGMLTATGALILPIFVPVSGGLFKGGNGPGNGDGNNSSVTLGNPIVDLRRDLISQNHIPLVEARTTGDPSYLRLTVLDKFNGVEWLPSERRLTTANDANGTFPTAPGLAPGTAGTEADWDLRLDEEFQTSWLPTPYPTRRITITDGDWRYDLRTLDVASVDKRSTAGLHYQLTGFTPNYSTARMQQAFAAPAQIRKTMTAVPGNRPSVLTRIAEEVTAGATTDYDRMVKLQAWFRTGGGFAYSLEAASGSGITQLVKFLTTDKVGYCEQFAAAMAILARTLDIPSRVVVGFLTPEQLDDGSYRYTSDDLHAWPEMYFSGTGWVRFEPTPGSRTGLPPAWTTAAALQAPSASPSATTAPSRQPTDKVGGASTNNPSDRSTGNGSTAAAWVAGFALVLLLLSLPRLIRTRQRRRRLDDHRLGPRTDDAHTLADGAWAELLATARDLGIALPLRRSVRDIAEALRRRGLAGSQARGQLDELVLFVERARYGRSFTVDPATRQAVVAAVEAWSEILAASVPAAVARIAQVFPRSLLDREAPTPVDRQVELVGTREIS